MKRFAWCTDIHLDNVIDVDIRALCSRILDVGAQGVFLTGDISTGPDVVGHLRRLRQCLGKLPIYFVAGNHDYYGTSVSRGRQALRELGAGSGLCYMPCQPHVRLTKATALVGHDGWYDCRNGDPGMTDFLMSDWSQIGEFAAGWIMPPGIYGNDSRGDPGRFAEHVVRTARSLAQEGAAHVTLGVESACAAGHKNVLVLTHFPPFVEAVQGDRRQPGSLPWYSSRTMGEALLRAAETHPRTQFTVLCGHTHTQCSVRLLSNLTCHVGKASYGSPAVQLPLDVE
jgi:predicted phosphohydrolase